jgi:endogenous inhibitor of DNA gyrase (YacG/DUF329 family)
MASKGAPASDRGRCPICRAPAEPAFRPFCSARCRDVDLARWLGGGYAIAGGVGAADEDGEDAAAQRAGGGVARTDDEDGG